MIEAIFIGLIVALVGNFISIIACQLHMKRLDERVDLLATQVIALCDALLDDPPDPDGGEPIPEEVAELRRAA